MAIEEHDREDLLRDGRNMPLRGQCWIDGIKVVVGFRDRGQLSLYCGADPVFQFNEHCQLRRAFCDGNRFAAEKGAIVQLNRTTRGGKVTFESSPVDLETQSSLATSLKSWIDAIRVATSESRWETADGNSSQFLDRIGQWLEEYPQELVIARTPNA